jgi:probable F420-dependent oxidoreductase
VRVSLGLPVDRPGVGDDLLSGDGVAAVARAAEAAGIWSVFVTDHPAPDERWLRHGGHPTLDPFVALSFAAAATTTLRLHTNLLVLPYRNPFLAAKSVASLDVLSGGRVVLGVGVGYLTAEFAALGAGFDERAALVDDALVTMKEAWTGQPVHRTGPGYRAEGTVVQPRPAQRPHPPIWVGGNSTGAMRRAVEHGAGWSPMPSPKAAAKLLGTPGLESVDELAGRIRRLHELAAEAGRAEPLDVAVIPTTLSGFGSGRWEPEAVLDEVAALRAAGGTVLVVNLPGRTRAEFLGELRRFVAEVLTPLQSRSDP